MHKISISDVISGFKYMLHQTHLNRLTILLDFLVAVNSGE